MVQGDVDPLNGAHRDEILMSHNDAKRLGLEDGDSIVLTSPTGALRGRVTAAGEDAPELHVPGTAEHQARRLTDWLKREAGRDLRARAAFHARRLGVTVTSLQLRDQSSRWGSCSSSGRLNFNWRLILAPPFVLD
jgi:predicted metal-dependent hydrolase